MDPTSATTAHELRRAVTTGLVASAVAALLWAVLAAARPTVTLHLAPALVVGIGPYAAWSRLTTWSGTAAATTALGSAVVATITTLLLDAPGWLAGPVLFGANAAAEALVVIAVATPATVATGIVVARALSSRRTP